jgi:hypothetical protein
LRLLNSKIFASGPPSGRIDLAQIAQLQHPQLGSHPQVGSAAQQGSQPQVGSAAQQGSQPQAGSQQLSQPRPPRNLPNNLSSKPHDFGWQQGSHAQGSQHTGSQPHIGSGAHPQGSQPHIGSGAHPQGSQPQTGSQQLSQPRRFSLPNNLLSRPPHFGSQPLSQAHGSQQAGSHPQAGSAA